MNFILQEWTEKDYNQYSEYLKSIAENDYADFTKKLNPCACNVLGIRMPVIRKIAYQISAGNWRDFLHVSRDDTFEETMIKGIVLGYAETDITEIIMLLTSYVKKIDNWATCDSVCASLHITQKYQNEMLDFLHNCIHANKEYEIRFAVVMLMNYYVDKEHIDSLLEILDSIKYDGYYVKMSVAWALSFCFVMFRERTMDYLKANTLDDFTYNKTLQKIIESYRVDKETKAMIKKMKRKKERLFSRP